MASKRARSQRNYRRNVRRREALMAEGYSEAQARAIVEQEGREMAAIHEARRQEEAAAVRPVVKARQKQKAREEKLYPVQPEEPRSVVDFPSGGFETNRRRH